MCGKVGRTCNPFITTDNSSTIFTDLGVKCTLDPQPWWADNQPGWVSVKTVRVHYGCGVRVVRDCKHARYLVAFLFLHVRAGSQLWQVLGLRQCTRFWCRLRRRLQHCAARLPLHGTQRCRRLRHGSVVRCYSAGGLCGNVAAVTARTDRLVQNEFEIFSTVMLPGSFGVMTHFWYVASATQHPHTPTHMQQCRTADCDVRIRPG